MENQAHDGDMDERHPEISTTTIFNLIPDVWKYILPHLSPSDFYSLYNTSQHFREMYPFHTRICNNLVPQVLPILLQNDRDIPAESLLRWRGVNRCTKTIVDSYLHEPNSPHSYYKSLTTRGAEWSPNVVDEKHHMRSAVEQIRSRYNLIKRPRTITFIERNYPSEAGMKIPVLTKSLCLSINDIWDGVGVNSYTSHILGHCGETIESVTFCTINYGGLIFKMLRLLPNTKILRMKGSPRLALQQGIVPDFQLNNLELLDVEDLNDERHPLSHHILQLCQPTLKKLICKGEFVQRIRYMNAFDSGLPSLRSLRMKDVRPGFSSSLLRLNPLALEELQLQGNDESGCTLFDFCQTINAFAKTLIDFKWCILLQHKGSLRDLTLCSQLENLTEFSTEIGNISTNWMWYFLQMKCPALTELNLHGSDRIQGVTIKMLKRKFNILPMLKKITISSGFDSLATGIPERVVLLRDGPVKRRRFVKITAADNVN